MFEDPLTVSILGGVARWLAMLIIGWLVAHHIIAVDQSASLTDHLTHNLVVGLPLLAPLAWSLWRKYGARVKFLTALTSTSESEVHAKIATGIGVSVKENARLSIVLLACLLGSAAVTLPGCASKAPTKAAAVADYATKIQQGANVILHAAQQGNAIFVPSTGRPLVSDAQLITVALVVNKVGHLGKDLTHALEDYSAAAKAGGDLMVLRAVVEKIVADIALTMRDVGQSIPTGTIGKIDQAVTDIFFALNLVKGGFGL